MISCLKDEHLILWAIGTQCSCQSHFTDGNIGVDSSSLHSWAVVAELEHKPRTSRAWTLNSSHSVGSNPIGTGEMRPHPPLVYSFLELRPCMGMYILERVRALETDGPGSRHSFKVYCPLTLSAIDSSNPLGPLRGLEVMLYVRWCPQSLAAQECLIHVVLLPIPPFNALSSSKIFI